MRAGSARIRDGVDESMSYALDDKCPDCDGVLVVVETSDDTGDCRCVACSCCEWFTHDVDWIRVRSWLLASELVATSTDFKSLFIALTIAQQHAANQGV